MTTTPQPPAGESDLDPAPDPLRPDLPPVDPISTYEPLNDPVEPA